MIDKFVLRKEMTELRSRISAEDAEKLTAEACKIVLASEEWRSANTVMLYLPFNNELDTSMLINAAESEDKRVLMPLCGKDFSMKAVDYTGKTLKTNSFGIQEPPDGDDIMPDLAVVPCLAIDKTCLRLGYGAGYYDRYFNRRGYIKKIGLIFPVQVLDLIEAQEHDCRLDAYCTAEGIFFRSI